MKILIDTNIYLDFYRSNTEAMKMFEEIEKHFDNLILTEQIINEFGRSREVVIREVRKKFDVESNLQHFSSSFLQNLPEFKELIKLKDAYQLQQRIIKEVINNAIISQANDPVAEFFNRFVNHCNQSDSILSTTEKIINKAHNRKLIGNPPTTADKYSIGDEINWETILENVKDDLILVGRDNTYQQNINFLKYDFHRHTGKHIIKITDRITDALKEIGVETSEDLKDAENNMIEELKHFNDYWKTPII